MDMIITKTCNLCGEQKLLDEFYVSNVKSKKHPVRDSVCKPCRIRLSSKRVKEKGNAEKKIRYHNNPIKYREERRECRQRHYEKQLLRGIKYRAKMCGIEFSITEEDIEIPKICPYLDIEIKINNRRVEDNSPSVDRINPNMGYIRGNIQVISMKANRMKNSATIDELVFFARNVLKLHSR